MSVYGDTRFQAPSPAARKIFRHHFGEGRAIAWELGQTRPEELPPPPLHPPPPPSFSSRDGDDDDNGDGDDDDDHDDDDDDG